MLSPISSMKIEWATLSIKGIGFSYSKNLSVERTRKGNASRLPPADRRTRKRAVSIFRTLIKDTDYLGDKQSEDLFLWDSGFPYTTLFRSLRIRAFTGRMCAYRL